MQDILSRHSGMSNCVFRSKEDYFFLCVARQWIGKQNDIMDKKQPEQNRVLCCCKRRVQSRCKVQVTKLFNQCGVLQIPRDVEMVHSATDKQLDAV